MPRSLNLSNIPYTEEFATFRDVYLPAGIVNGLRGLLGEAAGKTTSNIAWLAWRATILPGAVSILGGRMLHP